jgi:hypothetical protein
MPLRPYLEPLFRRDRLDESMEEEMRFHIGERAAASSPDQVHQPPSVGRPET